jgi:hypothetical protein
VFGVGIEIELADGVLPCGKVTFQLPLSRRSQIENPISFRPAKGRRTILTLTFEGVVSRIRVCPPVEP